MNVIWDVIKLILVAFLLRYDHDNVSMSSYSPSYLFIFLKNRFFLVNFAFKYGSFSHKFQACVLRNNGAENKTFLNIITPF